MMNNREDRKKIKRNSIMILLSVIILTIISLNYSYSAFFSIESRSTVQEISTGTLDVTASATPMNEDDLFPNDEALPSDEKSLLSSPDDNYASLVVNNNGNIDANYVVTLSYDTTDLSDDQIANDLVSFENLIIGIFDEDNKSWLNLNPNITTDAVYNMKVTDFTESEPGIYPILKRTILKATMDETATTPTVQNLRVYVWLADNTPISEIGKLVHLKLNVRSMPIKGQQNS